MDLKAQLLIQEYEEALQNLRTTAQSFADHYKEEWQGEINNGQPPHVDVIIKEFVSSIWRDKYATNSILYISAEDWVRSWVAGKTREATGGWFDIADHELWMVEAFKKWAIARINLNLFLEDTRNFTMEIQETFSKKYINILKSEYIIYLQRELKILDVIIEMWREININAYMKNQVAWQKVYRRDYLDNAKYNSK